MGQTSATGPHLSQGSDAMFNHPARLIIPCSLYHPTRLQHIVVLDACESVCTWLSDRALLKTPPPGSFLHEIQKQQLQKRPAYLFPHEETARAHANYPIKENPSYFLNTPALIAFICCEKIISREKKCKCA